VSGEYRNLADFVEKMQPREKMEEFGPSALKDSELLAIIFGTGYLDENVLELSERVLRDYGAKAILKAKFVGEVQDTVGLPPVKSMQLLATLELGRRFFAPEFGEFPTIRSPEDAFKCFAKMANYKKEVCEAIYLNAKNRVIHREVISMGNLESTPLDPAEVFEPAIAARALGVIVAHNHPSGDPTPSAEDREQTEILRKAGDILRKPLLDHLVIAGGEFVSILG
jgi:DNA repair protein RadC